jgi:acyl dehydratase
MREIASLDELKKLVGQEVAVSAWVTVDQERIDRFADATGDHQWIHVDPERCRRESPYGRTIAHGFLTLSLLPMMVDTTVALPAARMTVNYGLNKVRYPAPAPAGSRLRGRIRLMSLDDVPGGTQMVWEVSIEREGGDKPVCVAELIARRYI